MRTTTSSPWPIFVGIGAGGCVAGIAAVMYLPDWAIGGTGERGMLWFVLAIGVYLFSHCLRVLRTGIVLGQQVRHVRWILAAHAGSAPWGLLPFKIGDLVRIFALGRATSGFGEGLRTVWVERTFDAAFIALVAAIVISAQPESAAVVAPVGIAALALLVGTAIAVVTLPENLSMAKLWVLRRYTTSWSLIVLARLDDLGDAVRALRALINGKVTTLAALTIAIWATEVTGVGLLIVDVQRLGGVVPLLGMLSGLVQVDAADSAVSLLAWRTIVVGSLLAMGTTTVGFGIFKLGARADAPR